MTSKRTAFFRQVRIENCLFTVTIDYNFSASSPAPTRMHNHAAYELYFVRSGRLLYRIGTENVEIRPGQCCVIKPGIYHSKQAAGVHDSYRLKLTMDSATSAALSDALPWTNGLCTQPVGESVFQLLHNIHIEFTGMNWGKDQRLHAYLTLLIMELWGRTLAASANMPASPPAEDDYPMKIDEFFALHFKEDITCAHLAAALFVSERQVSRILKCNYGMSFKSKLSEIRINAAKELLLATDQSVTQIAQNLGYRNARYFTRMFRANTGRSPSAFRRGYQQPSGK